MFYNVSITRESEAVGGGVWFVSAELDFEGGETLEEMKACTPMEYGADYLATFEVDADRVEELESRICNGTFPSNELTARAGFPLRCYQFAEGVE